MAIVNLLKGAYTKKLGQTVGSKWKDKNTIRTYSIPADPKTQAQQNIRHGFSEINEFVALFADQLKYLTALDTSSMSLRNRIISINKTMVANNSFSVWDLAVSRGGLQQPQNFNVSRRWGDSEVIVADWDEPIATNITENAKMVVIAVDTKNKMAEVITAKAHSRMCEGEIVFEKDADLTVYAYFLDTRGSGKVASPSVVWATGEPPVIANYESGGSASQRDKAVMGNRFSIYGDHIRLVGEDKNIWFAPAEDSFDIYGSTSDWIQVDQSQMENEDNFIQAATPDTLNVGTSYYIVIRTRSTKSGHESSMYLQSYYPVKLEAVEGS